MCSCSKFDQLRCSAAIEGEQLRCTAAVYKVVVCSWCEKCTDGVKSVQESEGSVAGAKDVCCSVLLACVFRTIQ